MYQARFAPTETMIARKPSAGSSPGDSPTRAKPRRPSTSKAGTTRKTVPETDA